MAEITRIMTHEEAEREARSKPLEPVLYRLTDGTAHAVFFDSTGARHYSRMTGEDRNV